jgi:[glutamine synthetase] adenylyltransferase / [glutamine synthetase]-adenylyl-L-tyrosine phosphorylase
MLKKLSEDFLNKIFSLSLPAEDVEKLISSFENEASSHYFSREAESNLIRIIFASFDKTTFLTDCIKYPRHAEILISTAANSNYLTDILIRSPEYFYWIANPSNLNEKIEFNSFSKSVEATLKQFKSFTAKVNSLRRIKRKEILRIGLKDILNEISVQEVTDQLSILAKVISSRLFEICYEEILVKNKISSCRRKYAIAALGKLGGNELNYSSDIDLIIFYDENEEIKPNKFYNEILTEAIYLFIESAVSVTGAGYIYRIDFRLRPDGRNAPLTRSLNEYLSYYESRGEDWERQMLIKAGFAGGDEMLFNSFINYLQPFIYPSTFLSSPKEQIKHLKQNIEKTLADHQNIKLSPGGIRDIEFSVQALQLLNGGKIKELRTGSTLTAINMLKKYKLLTAKEAKTFSDSYILYRKIEHYLQLMNDKQTHSIPVSGELLHTLSKFLKYKSSKYFLEEVREKRASVKKIYNSILGEKDETIHAFDFIFDNKKKAMQDLQFLREGKGITGIKQFDSQTIEAFGNIEKGFIKYLKTSASPDLILTNFTRIIKNAVFPSIWYKEFNDKKFFNIFLDVCAYSQKGVDLFAEDKELRELFLARKIYSKDALSEIKNVKQLHFILSIQLAAGIINVKKVSAYLTAYYLNKVRVISDKYLKEKDIENYFIAGMGSLGSGEMNFASDIDLIFGVKEIKYDVDLQKIFQSLLTLLKSELHPVEVDCRLRPEGKSSMLVWDLQGYKNYILNRGRVWELQSFTKLSFITGDKKLFSRLIVFMDEKSALLQKDEIKKEIYRMRQKLLPQGIENVINIKRSRGGLTDIEFTVQYILLTNNKLFKRMKGKSILKILKSLDELIPESKILSDNFTLLKEIQIASQNIFSTNSSILSMEGVKFKILSQFLKYEQEDLQKKINSTLKSNHRIFSKYLQQHV